MLHVCGVGGRLRRTRVQVELDMRILLLLVAVVVRPALDHLHVAQLDVGRGRLGGHEAAERNYHGDGEGNRGEEAKDILQSHQCRVHLGGFGVVLFGRMRRCSSWS